MEEFSPYLEGLIPRTYLQQGIQNIRSRDSKIQQLLQHKKLPKDGWEDDLIEYFIDKMASMDSNNFGENAGVGEREGRIFSNLVARRHFHLSHGIGRSGDIIEVQPKAAGSSILYKLTNKLVNHAIQVAGLNPSLECIVFPLATGMTLALTWLTLKSLHPEKKYVVFSRIDQKSCFKSVVTANLIPIVVDPILVEGELQTNLVEIENILIAQSHEILGVFCTTSCFAPRQPDKVDKVALLCKQYGVCHVINNAYGLQCADICKSINRAIINGRVDAIVQSTDKNFLTPVGGAILASPNPEILKRVSSNYPGRANMSPILDILITLLCMGENGYKKLLCERLEILQYLRSKLDILSESFGLEILPNKTNKISFSLRLDSLEHHKKPLSFLGSMLFQRQISGCRVVTKSLKITTISETEFVNWGAHHSDFPHSYFTVACAIGITKEDVDLFMKRISKVLSKYIKMNSEEEKEVENGEI